MVTSQCEERSAEAHGRDFAAADLRGELMRPLVPNSARWWRRIFWAAVACTVVLLAHGVTKWLAARSSRDRWGAPALVATSVWMLGGLAVLRLAVAFAARRFPARALRFRAALAHRRAQMALTAASCVLSLGGAEWAARRCLPAPPLEWLHDYAGNSFDQNDWRTSFCEFDPELGWRGRPHASGWCSRPGLRFWVEQNSAGFRDIEHASESAEDIRRIVVLGDSFVWGFGVEQDETVTARLRTLFDDADVHNLAVCGYGTDQSLLTFERAAGELRVSSICYLFYANDLLDNQISFQHGHAKPRFALSNGTLELKRPPSRESRDAERLASVAADSPPSPLALLAQPAVSLRRVGDYYVSPRSAAYRYLRRALDRPTRDADSVALDPLAEALILAMRRDCDRLGASFTLVLVPERRALKSPEPAGYFAAVRAWAVDVGIDCLDLTGPLVNAGAQPYLEEGHWNAAGHDIAAVAIARHLLKQSVTLSTAPH